MDSDRRRVGAPNHSIVQCSNVAPELFWQLLLSHLHWKYIILSSSSYSLRGNTKEPYYFLYYLNIYANCKCGTESAAFLVLPPPFSRCVSYLLHHAVCSGSWPLPCLLGFCLGLASEKHQQKRRVEGKERCRYLFPWPPLC